MKHTICTIPLAALLIILSPVLLFCGIIYAVITTAIWADAHSRKTWPQCWRELLGWGN